MRALVALLFAVSLSAQNVAVTFIPPAALPEFGPADWTFVIRNVSGRDLPSVPVTLHLSPGTMQDLPAEYQCVVIDAFGIRCTLPPLQQHSEVAISVKAQHPFRYGSVSVSASVPTGGTLPEQTYKAFVFYREFPVTTTADAGPGSLRQAILDINAAPECRYRFPDWTAPCKVLFQINEPVPAEGWYTIRPLTPLPALTAYHASIDSLTQQANNTLGPTVFLDGSALTFGNGIVAEGESVEGQTVIRGLAIGGFPWNGIYSTTRTMLTVDQCYIGVDPSGRRAHPNGSRGVVSSQARGYIQNNVISGNARSGVFFPGSPHTGPHIRNNRIGVGAHDDTPIGNGASGIFIGDFHGYYTDPTIEGNVIANNAHFGIALTANAPMIILGNTIRDNGGGGIDIDLDGPTLSKPGVPGVQGGVAAVPVITSATYANGVTTIKGIAVAGMSRRVLLYANSKLEPDGFAEGEQFLGITPVQVREDTAFTFEYPGDLRGKYINGSVYAVTFWGWDDYSHTSSELGRAVAVTE